MLSVVERTRRSSTLPSVSPRRARIQHLPPLHHFHSRIANLQSWEDFAGEYRRFENYSSRREAVGQARNTCQGKRCGCGSER